MSTPPLLTVREKEVLPFLMVGATRKEIAHALEISTETIKFHVRNILDKFDAVSVRDGFNDLLQYQTYYGVGGLDVRRYLIDTETELTVMPGRRDASLFQKHQYLIVSGDYRGHRLNFSMNTNLDDIEIGGAQIVSSNVSGGMRAVDIVPNEGTVFQGDTFELTIRTKFMDLFANKRPEYNTNITVPASKRTVTVIFPKEDCPEAVQGKYWLANTVVGGAIDFDKTPGHAKFGYSTTQVLINHKLQVLWDWAS